MRFTLLLMKVRFIELQLNKKSLAEIGARVTKVARAFFFTCPHAPFNGAATVCSLFIAPQSVFESCRATSVSSLVLPLPQTPNKFVELLLAQDIR